MQWVPHHPGNPPATLSPPRLNFASFAPRAVSLTSPGRGRKGCVSRAGRSLPGPGAVQVLTIFGSVAWFHPLLNLHNIVTHILYTILFRLVTLHPLLQLATPNSPLASHLPRAPTP